MVSEISYMLAGVLLGIISGLVFCYETLRKKYPITTQTILLPILEITTISAVIFGIIGWVIGILIVSV